MPLVVFPDTYFGDKKHRCFVRMQHDLTGCHANDTVTSRRKNNFMQRIIQKRAGLVGADWIIKQICFDPQQQLQIIWT